MVFRIIIISKAVHFINNCFFVEYQLFGRYETVLSLTVHKLLDTYQNYRNRFLINCIYRIQFQ